MKKESIPVRNSLLLLLTATIWGVAFVAQSVSMDYIGGFTFNAVRNLIGALTLLPVIWGLGKTKAPEEKKRIQASSDRKTLITGGICCGILLCFASNFQQFGIKYTSVGKAGFITACYIVIVPIIGIFLKKKCSPFIWIAVILSLCGLYLLCLTPGEGFAITRLFPVKSSPPTSEISNTAIENTSAPRNFPHAGSSAPENTFPTTLEKIIATTIKNPAMIARMKYLKKSFFSRVIFAFAAFDSFCTSS